MLRREVVAHRVRGLVEDFGRYVSAYDSSPPFSADQLAAHRATLALRRQAGSVRAAIADPEFVSSLRRTLIAWRLNARASRLAAEPDFAAALTAALPAIQALEPFRIDEDGLPDDLPERLWSLTSSLAISENDAKVVSGTKALQHLLPDLVPPMDRRWTGTFFGLHLPEWQGENQRRTFLRLYRTFVDIARHTAPQSYVTGDGWRTCRTKILDNGLIGYCQTELVDDSPPDASSAMITFRVAGYPPAKNEAKSMLSAGHPHAPRVRSLLDAALQALASHPRFEPALVGPVELDLVVYAGEQDPWDATNYLGGVADVLEDKARRGADITHLGDLASVWLYANDRQIKQVSYREVQTHDDPGYVVTVRARRP